MQRAILFLILIGFLVASCWTPVTSFLHAENQRYKARICDSFSIGLTQSEIRTKYGEPDSISFSDKSDEVWVYRFRPEPKRLNDFFTVKLCFNNKVCTGSTSTIGVKDLDRVILWSMVLQRQLMPAQKQIIGNSEKVLAMQFGNVPRGMGYPEQSEVAKNSYGVTMDTFRSLGLGNSADD